LSLNPSPRIKKRLTSPRRLQPRNRPQRQARPLRKRRKKARDRNLKIPKHQVKMTKRIIKKHLLKSQLQRVRPHQRRSKKLIRFNQQIKLRSRRCS
jgi:hypothetical protein